MHLLPYTSLIVVLSAIEYKSPPNHEVGLQAVLADNRSWKYRSTWASRLPSGLQASGTGIYVNTLTACHHIGSISGTRGVPGPPRGSVDDPILGVQGLLCCLDRLLSFMSKTPLFLLPQCSIFDFSGIFGPLFPEDPKFRILEVLKHDLGCPPVFAIFDQNPCFFQKVHFWPNPGQNFKP